MLRPLLLAAALAAPGCIVVHDDGPSTGTLTVRWSIDRSFSPNACSFHRAAFAQVQTSGGTVQASCSAFAASVSLPTGRHSVAVTMLDAGGRPVSTTINVVADIYYARETFLDTDFPTSSFF